MAEHLLYTVAIILIIGIFYTKLTGMTYHWWIILLGSIIADLDHFNNFFWDAGILPYEVEVIPYIHLGNFHNIFWLVIVSVIVAGILTYKNIDFSNGLILCGIGYGIHLFEDFLVYPPVYTMLYPFSNTPVGLNLIPETKNLLWAGTEVLMVGISFLVIAIIMYAVSTMFCITNIPNVKEEE